MSRLNLRTYDIPMLEGLPSERRSLKQVPNDVIAHQEIYDIAMLVGIAM